MSACGTGTSVSVRVPERVEQAAHAVYDDAIDGVAHARYRLHRLHIVRDGLVLDEGDIERPAGGVIKRKQHTPVASPIGHVEMDKAAHPVEVRLLPPDGDSAQPALDGRRAYPRRGGYLDDCLLFRLVQRPKLAVSHRVTTTKLLSADHALVKLFPIPRAVALRYP